MQKKLILDSHLLDITLNRLCHQILENHASFENTVVIGMQPRGIFLANLIHKKLELITGKEIPFGHLDTTFHRDDFRRREIPAKLSETKIDFVNDKKSTKTSISYVVKNTTIREHMKTETAQFTMQGRHYTFVRLEMPKEVFDTLIAEAKQAKAQ